METSQKNSGNIISTGDVMPSVNKIPSVKNEQNYTQKLEIGDTVHSGGIFPTYEDDYRTLDNVITKDICKFDCYYYNNFQTNIIEDY